METVNWNSCQYLNEEVALEKRIFFYNGIH